MHNLRIYEVVDDVDLLLGLGVSAQDQVEAAVAILGEHASHLDVCGAKANLDEGAINWLTARVKLDGPDAALVGAGGGARQPDGVCRAVGDSDVGDVLEAGDADKLRALGVIVEDHESTCAIVLATQVNFIIDLS